MLKYIFAAAMVLIPSIASAQPCDPDRYFTPRDTYTQREYRTVSYDTYVDRWAPRRKVVRIVRQRQHVDPYEQPSRSYRIVRSSYDDDHRKVVRVVRQRQHVDPYEQPTRSHRIVRSSYHDDGYVPPRRRGY